MQRTYLVAIELPPSEASSPEGYSEVIRESLADDGIPVVSVKVWSGDTAIAETDLPPGMSMKTERLF